MKTLQFVSVLATAATLSVACHRDRDNQTVSTDTARGRSTAPSSAAADDRDHALVRVIHVIPGSGAVDVYIADKKAFDSVAYKTVTPYKEVPANEDDFTARLAGQDAGTPLAENSEGILSGRYYTLVVFPSRDGKGASLQVFTDDPLPSNNGKASFRVINAAPDVDEVSVAPEGRQQDAWVRGLNFETVSAYKEVEPGTVTLDVKADTDRTERSLLKTAPIVTLTPTDVYTVVIAGRSNGANALEALVIKDTVSPSATN